MSTPLDCRAPLPGYYPSHWPCECAGPRRQKLTSSRGLDIQPGEGLSTTQRDMGEGRWPAMIVLSEPGEIYVQGGTQAFISPDSFGWVERVWVRSVVVRWPGFDEDVRLAQSSQLVSFS